jgi:hypothetical protein
MFLRIISALWSGACPGTEKRLSTWKEQFTNGKGEPTLILESVASQDLQIRHTFFGLTD